MNDYIRLSQSDYRSLKGLLPLFYDDEAYARLACFQIEQAIKKLLKGYMELKGFHSRQRHNIVALVTEAKELGIEIPKDFFFMSPVLTEWATKGRFDVNFRIEKEYLDKAIELYNELLAVLTQELKPQRNNASHLISPSADINDIK